MITLQYGTRTLTLPNPDFGDAERVALSNVFGTTRTGAVLNKYDAGQPVLKTLTWVISKMTYSQKQDLREFLVASAGDVISVTDYNSDTFSALITNTLTAITTLRDNCRYSTELNFVVIS